MCLFFTEAYFAFRFLLLLNDRIKSHLTVLESAQYRDKLFATKFCFALDICFFRWIEQCKGTKNRESVNNHFLKFDTLFDSVLIEQFHRTFPSTMRLVDDTKLFSSFGSGSGSLKEPDKRSKRSLKMPRKERWITRSQSRNGFALRMRTTSKNLLVNTLTNVLNLVKPQSLPTLTQKIFALTIV